MDRGHEHEDEPGGAEDRPDADHEEALHGLAHVTAVVDDARDTGEGVVEGDENAE